MINKYESCSASAGYLDKTVLLVLAGLGAFLVASIFYLPLEKTLYFYSDDAYYYFKVASNIIAGYGPTFDGYNLSNGFHPLWMVLLLPIYYLTGNSTELSLQLIFAFQVVLGVFAYWFFWIYVSRTLGRFYGALSLVILAVFASPILIAFNGLESVLLLFWLFAILVADYRFHLFSNSSSQNVVLTGVLFGLLFMTRLDTAYIILAFALLKLTGKQCINGFVACIYNLLKQYYPAIVIFILISTPYFIWNYATFGHLTPISGQIKSSFPYPHLNFNLHAGALPYTLAFLFTNLWILAEFLFFRSSKNTFLKRNSGIVKVYWLGSLIHFVWSSLFMQWAVFQWHFTAYIPLLTLFCIHVLEVILTKYSRTGYRAAAAIIVCVLSISYTLLVYVDKGDHLKYVYKSALWFREHADTNASVALADAGIFGYFSGRPTINLDGLINGYEYQDSIIEGTLPDFLKKQKVSYVVHTETSCEYAQKRIPILAYQGKYKYSPIGYTILLNKSDEFYKSEPVRYRRISENKVSCLVIWKMDPEDLRPV